MTRTVLLLVICTIGLCSCAMLPASNRYTADGRACKQVGYSFDPVWMDPRTGFVC
jgi:hypothetical protein